MGEHHGAMFQPTGSWTTDGGATTGNPPGLGGIILLGPEVVADYMAAGCYRFAVLVVRAWGVSHHPPFSTILSHSQPLSAIINHY